MGKQVFTNAAVFFGGYDVSGDLNAVACSTEVDIQDTTTFGSGGFREKLAGVKDTAIELAGFWEGGAGNIDAALFARIGLSNAPVSLSHDGADDGELAYFLQSLLASYQPGATHGETMKFSASAQGDGDLVRGTIMHKATRTASGNGVTRQLGAVSASQSMHAALHVLTADGTVPTLDVVIESDDNAGMSSATSRIVFDQATAIGGEFKSIAGATVDPVNGITDDYWRATYTIGGTGPSFLFALMLGIQ